MHINYQTSMHCVFITYSLYIIQYFRLKSSRRHWDDTHNFVHKNDTNSFSAQPQHKLAKPN